jgi:hypothetical protein
MKKLTTISITKRTLMATSLLDLTVSLFPMVALKSSPTKLTNMVTLLM